MTIITGRKKQKTNKRKGKGRKNWKSRYILLLRKNAKQRRKSKRTYKGDWKQRK